jgi:uncharacterized protein (UPF0332 family)
LIPEQEELIRYRMNRAKTSLTEARILFEKELLFAAVNRCYYAGFYAVCALLLTKDKSSSKHSGVLALFQAHIMKKGGIPTETGRFYSQLYKYHLKADYEDYAELKALEVLSLLDRTTQFVNQVNSIIERMLS